MQKGTRRISTCILLLGISLSISSQSNLRYFIENYSKQTYEAESQNWSVTHDSKGIIYAANNIGLLDFDGIEWTFHPAPNGTVIRGVAVDREDRVFTSGYREIGYWERNEFGRLEYLSLNSLASQFYSQNEEFWNIEFCSGKVFFHSFTSVFVYNGSGFNVIRPGSLISAIGTKDDTVFISLAGRGLFMVSDTTALPVCTDPLLSGSNIQFIEPYGTDSLLIGTADNGVFLFTQNRIEPFLVEQRDYFIKNNLNRGCIAENGMIITGTLLDGIRIFSRNGELLYGISMNEGLQNNTVLGLDYDINNGIWVSLDQGIDLISFHVDPSYEIHQNPEVGAVYDAAFHEGNIYLCSNLGVFYRRMESRDDPFIFIEGTQGQAWTCGIYNGQLLVGHNSGCFLIDNSRAVLLSTVNGGMAFLPRPGDRKEMFHATYTNLVSLEDTGAGWHISKSLNGFSDLIRFLEYDHLGRLWAGHMRRGIYTLILNEDETSVIQTRYYGTETFGKEYDINLFTIENRLVITTGEQMYTYDDLRDTIIPFRRLNENLGAYSGSHRVVPAPNHNYWLISRKGIALFHIFEERAELIREYSADLFSEHLVIGYENVVPIDSENALLCMDNGYAILKPGEPDLSESILDKKPEIKYAGFRGAPGQLEPLIISEGRILLPHHKNSLNLKYTFPYPCLGNVEFQSLIMGLDTDWSSGILSPEFSFERIPPGEYEIFVRAVNRWGKNSIADSIRLTVRRPWYLWKISFIVYAALLVAAALIVRRVLILRIRIRERNIKNTKERELIRLRNEKLNAELAFRSQELANSTMSIIKKNEFLLKLKEIIQRQKEDLGLRYPDKYYREIIQRIDRNVSSMDDWKVFEFHFEKAHEKFLQKMMNKFPQLTHGDLRLCAYLRMNLSTKEIAPLLRISVRGVENHRYKLRKKLNLPPEENLTEYIMGI